MIQGFSWPEKILASPFNNRIIGDIISQSYGIYHKNSRQAENPSSLSSPCIHVQIPLTGYVGLI